MNRRRRRAEFNVARNLLKKGASKLKNGSKNIGAQARSGAGNLQQKLASSKGGKKIAASVQQGRNGLQKAANSKAGQAAQRVARQTGAAAKQAGKNAKSNLRKGNRGDVLPSKKQLDSLTNKVKGAGKKTFDKVKNRRKNKLKSKLGSGRVTASSASRKGRSSKFRTSTGSRTRAKSRY